MRIFFSGATGVIGRRAVPLLLAKGHVVTAAIHDESSRERVSRGATCAVVDLFDRDTLRTAIDGHDTVINLATHIPSSAWKMMFRSAWRENDRIRSAGVRNLVDVARAAGVQRFIQESYAMTYPDRGDAWIDETTPLEPAGYNTTVVDAETAAMELARTATGVVLRFAGFYGPDATQIRILIAGMRRGIALLPGAASAFISTVSHDDAARAVVAALGATSGAYNVVDDEPVTHREYFQILSAGLGLSPPHFLPAWATPLFGSAVRSVARSLRLSNRKLRDETGWHPIYSSIRTGWPATVAELALARTTPHDQPRAHG